MTPTAPDFSQQFPPLLAPGPATVTPEHDDTPPPADTGIPENPAQENPEYRPYSPVFSVFPFPPVTQNTDTDSPPVFLEDARIPATPIVPIQENRAEPEPDSSETTIASDTTQGKEPVVQTSAKVPLSVADSIERAWQSEGFTSKHAYLVWVLSNHRTVATATAQVTNLTNKVQSNAQELKALIDEKNRLSLENARLVNQLSGQGDWANSAPLPAQNGAELATLRAENDRLARTHDQAVGRLASMEQRIAEYEVMMSVLQPALDYLYGLASTASQLTTPSVIPEYFRMAFEQYIQTEAQYSNQLANQQK